MKSCEQIDRLIAEQSAEWSERLRAGDERDLAAFAQWSLKSPQHMRHFLMMSALELELGRIDPARELPALQACDAAPDRVVAIKAAPDESPAHGPRAGVNKRRWASAAGIA